MVHSSASTWLHRHSCAVYDAKVRRGNSDLPKFAGDVINELLVLQDLLAVALEQQRGHTQVVDVKALELMVTQMHSIRLWASNQ